MKRIIIPLLFVTFFSFSCSNKDKNNNPVYPTNCATSLAGLYTGSDYCSTSPSTYSSTITASTPTNITISNLYGVPVTATLDCSTNRINIPTQSFSGNFSIYGSGTFTANVITINWNGNSLGLPINCSTTYTR